MIGLERLRKQVLAILEGNGFAWTAHDDGLELRFSSAVVSITFSNWGSQALIHLRANVLSGLGSSTAAAALEEANNLNCDTVFGRWVYYIDGGILALEYDLLGDHLQEPELMTALATIARRADHYDDKLQLVLGGRRATD